MYSYYCSLVVWVKYGHFQQSDITFSTSAYSKYLPLELILVLQIELYNIAVASYGTLTMVQMLVEWCSLVLNILLIPGWWVGLVLNVSGLQSAPLPEKRYNSLYLTITPVSGVDCPISLDKNMTLEVLSGFHLCRLGDWKSFQKKEHKQLQAWMTKLKK